MTKALPEDRFFKKVLIAPFHECWEWLAYKSWDGYGYFNSGKRNELAHRFSYRMFIGEIPISLCVLHKCDNPSCVNPEHLFIGTNDDNVKDKVQKTRQACGERMNRGSATAEDVAEIRRMHASGIRQSCICRLFKISSGSVSKIINGKSWKHI